MRKVHSFTLIELIVSISLLSLMGGWLLFKGSDLISSYKSSKAVHQFLEEVHLSKILALSYRSSITLQCIPHEEGVTLQRVCYTHPDYHKLGLNETIDIPCLIVENKLEIAVNSLGEIEDQEWLIKTRHGSYLVEAKNNQIFASTQKGPVLPKENEES